MGFGFVIEDMRPGSGLWKLVEEVMAFCCGMQRAEGYLLQSVPLNFYEKLKH